MALQFSENGTWLDTFIGSGSTESSEQPALSEEAVANLISATSSAAATATSSGKLFNWHGLFALWSVN